MTTYNIACSWIEKWLKFKMFPYQKEFIDGCMTHKRVAGLWPRQTGKTLTVAAYSTYKASMINDCKIIIVAPTQNQSTKLFQKIQDFIIRNDILKQLVVNMNQTEVLLQNGSSITALPCGPFGHTILGHTANILIIEESGVMKDDIVNMVLMPMIAATDGQVIKIGTPRNKNHFYQSCYGANTDYSLFHFDWRRAMNEGLYKEEFLIEQKKQMTDTQFATEYEARFVENLNSFFSEELLESVTDNSYKLIESVY